MSPRRGAALLLPGASPSLARHGPHDGARGAGFRRLFAAILAPMPSTRPLFRPRIFRLTTRLDYGSLNELPGGTLCPPPGAGTVGWKVEKPEGSGERGKGGWEKIKNITSEPDILLKTQGRRIQLSKQS